MKLHSLWGETKIINLNKEKLLYYVPIDFNNNYTGFIFIKNKISDSITRSYMSEIKINENLNHDFPEEILANFLNQKPQTITGSISLYTINNKFIFEEGFVNGIFKYRKKIVKNGFGDNNINSNYFKSNNLSSKSIKSNSCTIYYEITYWSDNTVDYRVLDVICDISPCEQTRVISKVDYGYIKTFCLTGIGGGGTSAITSDVSSIFLLPDSFAWQYPKFYQLMKNLSIDLQGKYLNSLLTLSNITGLSQNRILEIVQMGRGPRIEIANLNPVGSNTTTIFGRFDKIYNVIYLDQNLLNIYENPLTKYSDEAMNFFMTVTVLHETVHYGINQNISLFGNNGLNIEFGKQWEYDTFKQFIDDPADAESYYLKIHP